MRRAVRLSLIVACLATLVACGDGGGGGGTRAAGREPATTDFAPVPPGPVLTPGMDAWVAVTVANLWDAPDQARPLDQPSLTNPVDTGAWLAAMSVDDRRWLVDRLVTQALYGDRMVVLESAGGWTKVVVPRQPSSLDPRGYPGWLPTVQLTTVGPDVGRAARREDVVVTRPTTGLRDPDRPEDTLLRLSFNTRLPVLAAEPPWVTVALPGPGGGQGLLAATDVAVLTADPADSADPAPEEVVRSAQMFGGVDYLWAGTSNVGWDCSGLTSAAYAAHGITIPRDADDQAGAGTPVERADLRPGDLLFFATGTDRRSIHHVAMYVGDGRMIQAPATGRKVETVPIDQPGLNQQYWGARRYVP